MRGGWIGIVLGLFAIGEYIADALPQIPSRTTFPSSILRPASGGFCGWMIAGAVGASPVWGAILGVAGALAGMWGGLAFRKWLIERSGAIPAAVIEDIIAIGLSVLFVLTARAQSQPGSAVTANATVGNAAPAFSLKTIDGRTLTLADYRGRTLVLNVWGSWCPPCRQEAPTLAVLAQQYRSQGVAFLGDDVGDTPSNALAFTRSVDISYPSISDPSYLIVQRFSQVAPVSDTPTTVVIDKTGHVAGMVLGEVSYGQMTTLLRNAAVTQ
jgi:peroxiredoxin/uncharacterized membrane protein